MVVVSTNVTKKKLEEIESVLETHPDEMRESKYEFLKLAIDRLIKIRQLEKQIKDLEEKE